jgi:hypothetical protein
VRGAVRADTKNPRNFDTGRDGEGANDSSNHCARKDPFPEGMFFSLDRDF